MKSKYLSKGMPKALREIRFKVETVLGFPVETAEGYWDIITKIKHPSISRKERSVKKCLLQPDEVRVSKKG